LRSAIYPKLPGERQGQERDACTISRPRSTVPLPEAQGCQGTSCAFSLSRKRLGQFAEYLEAAERKILDGNTDRFEGMFE